MHCIRDACDQIFEATQDQFQVHDWLVNDLCARRVCVVTFAIDDATGDMVTTFTNRIAYRDNCRGCGAFVFAIDSQHLRKPAPSRFVGPRDCVVARETRASSS